MPARLSAFLIWSLVALSAMYWGLRFFAVSPVAPAHTLLVAESGSARVDLTRLFGAPPVAATTTVVAPAIASRFQLTGVMAPKVAGADGVALIAVDGKMPRAYHVGASIDGELVLQSVSLRSASIGPVKGAPAVVLELPAPQPPATGSLPAFATMQPPPSAIAPMPAMVPQPIPNLAAPSALAPAPPVPAVPAVPQGVPASTEAPTIPPTFGPGRRIRGMGTAPGQQPAAQQ